MKTNEKKLNDDALNNAVGGSSVNTTNWKGALKANNPATIKNPNQIFAGDAIIIRRA